MDGTFTTQLAVIPLRYVFQHWLLASTPYSGLQLRTTPVPSEAMIGPSNPTPPTPLNPQILLALTKGLESGLGMNWTRMLTGETPINTATAR